MICRLFVGLEVIGGSVVRLPVFRSDHPAFLKHENRHVFYGLQCRRPGITEKALIQVSVISIPAVSFGQERLVHRLDDGIDTEIIPHPFNGDVQLR